MARLVALAMLAPPTTLPAAITLPAARVLPAAMAVPPATPTASARAMADPKWLPFTTLPAAITLPAAMLLPAASAVAAPTLAAPPHCVAPATVAAPARLAPPPRPRASCACGWLKFKPHNRPIIRLALTRFDKDILITFMVRSFLWLFFLFRGPILQIAYLLRETTEFVSNLHAKTFDTRQKDG